ncbi:MAG: cytidylate kinase-like family protein [Lachnospiraceae bacterium]|nr:cytidylate kinase-like family protein [Lachnospiraceae bacterium]
MDKQVIISVGREYGSGGHVIAKAIAERMNLPYYDHEILNQIAKEMNVDPKTLKEFEEKKHSSFFSRTVRGYNNSPEEQIAQLQFDYMRKKAASGESFVIVGRCAESVLSEYPGLISIFVVADRDAKIARTAQVNNLNLKDAEVTMLTHDKYRKAYHNHYANMKWGDSRLYDMCINSTRLGIEKTTDVVYDYIQSRIQNL